MARDPPLCIGCGRPVAPSGGKVRRVEGLPVCDYCDSRPPPALLDEGFGQRPEFRRGPNLSGILWIIAAVPWLVWLAAMSSSGATLSMWFRASPELIDIALKFAGVGLLLCTAVLALLRMRWLLALVMGFSGMVLLVWSSFYEMGTTFQSGVTQVLVDIPGVALVITALATTSKRDFYPARRERHRGPQVLPEGFTRYSDYAGARRGAETSGVLLLAAGFILVSGLIASVMTPGYWEGTSSQWFWGHVALLAAGVAALVLAGLLALADTRWSLLRWLPFLAVALIGGALMSTPGLPATRGHHLYEQEWVAFTWVMGLLVVIICSAVLVALAPAFEPGRPDRRRLPFMQGISVGIMLMAGEVAALDAVNCVSVWGYHLEDIALYHMPYQDVIDAFPTNLAMAVLFAIAIFSMAALLWRRGPKNEFIAIAYGLSIAILFGPAFTPTAHGAYWSQFTVIAAGLVQAAASAAVGQKWVERRTAGMPVVIHPSAGSVPYPVEIGEAGWTLRKSPGGGKER